MFIAFCVISNWLFTNRPSVTLHLYNSYLKVRSSRSRWQYCCFETAGSLFVSRPGDRPTLGSWMTLLLAVFLRGKYSIVPYIGSKYCICAYVRSKYTIVPCSRSKYSIFAYVRSKYTIVPYSMSKYCIFVYVRSKYSIVPYSRSKYCVFACIRSKYCVFAYIRSKDRIVSYSRSKLGLKLRYSALHISLH